MAEYTFTQWLRQEMTSAKCALLKLYEEHDRLRLIEGPRIEREYMEKVGKFEETVIAEEIECEVLQKKKELIQTALNRRERVDEKKLEEQLSKFRKMLLKEASGEGVSGNEDDGDSPMTDELQALYRQIVKYYHPQMNPGLTEVQKLLFEKAQDAYRRKDMEALQLIFDMLQSGSEENAALAEALLSGIQITMEVKAGVTEDYTLAAKLYRCFQSTVEDAALEEEIRRHRETGEGILGQIEALRKTFPYNAAGMLADPEQLEAYIGDLNLRLRNAKKERETRTEEIQKMMERVSDHE